MSNGVPDSEAEDNIDANGVMPVQGNYPKGTQPGLSKDSPAAANAELTKGWTKPVYTEGNVVLKADF